MVRAPLHPAPRQLTLRGKEQTKAMRRATRRLCASKHSPSYGERTAPVSPCCQPVPTSSFPAPVPAPSPKHSTHLKGLEGARKTVLGQEGDLSVQEEGHHVRHALGSQPRRKETSQCAALGGSPESSWVPPRQHRVPPNRQQQGGCSLPPPHNGVPSIPPQRHSLRAQVSGGSADDWDHGSQHLFLQQCLAQQRVGALCRQQEERDMLEPAAQREEAGTAP